MELIPQIKKQSTHKGENDKSCFSGVFKMKRLIIYDLSIYLSIHALYFLINLFIDMIHLLADL
jgi:hypothetical protein